MRQLVRGCLVLVSVLALLPPEAAYAAAPGLVISQVYGGGGNTGATWNSDYVELHNRTDAPVNPAGASVQYRSAGGYACGVAVLPSVTIPAGGYYLIEAGTVNESVGESLPQPDFAPEGFPNMSNTAGSVALSATADALACNADWSTVGSVVDLVGYTSTVAVPSEGDSALPGTATAAVTRRGRGCRDGQNNQTDFASVSAAPRNSTSGVYYCDRPGLSIANASVTEAESNVTAVFAVTLSAARQHPISVNYATAAGTARTPEDFAAKSGTINFPAGVATRTVSVTVTGDARDEPVERFSVRLSSPVNATVADGSGMGTIIDDDAPALSITNRSVTEGDDAARAAVFTVKLSAPTWRTVKVDWTTIEDTARSPRDFMAAGGGLTFSPGDVRRTLTIAIHGDQRDEENEAYRVRLSAPVNAVFGDRTGRGLILDDD